MNHSLIVIVIVIVSNSEMYNVKKYDFDIGKKKN